MKKLSFIIAAVLFSGACCHAQQKNDSTAYWIAVGAQLDSSIAALPLDTLHGEILAL